MQLGAQPDILVVDVFYSDKAGHAPLPTRLMAGGSILKHMHNLSDEDLCARWIENSYCQLFCVEEFFRHQLTFDRSSLTRWRQRMGEERLAALDPGEPGGRDAHRRGQAR
jgi:IS5 family transposase